MKVTIRPSAPFGKVYAPPSKSMAHRLLICAGLAKGKSSVRGIADSEDILATSDCLRMLGAALEKHDRAASENETGRRDISEISVDGAGFGRCCDETVLDCRESGSTLRFFIPICLLLDRKIILKGSGRLLQRPLDVYSDICKAQGILFEKNDNSVTCKGRLSAGEYVLPGNVSSQFISGLLFALPMLDGESTLRIIPPVESRPYIDMTLQAQRSFGVDCYWEDENTIIIPGGQRYISGDADVEGDYSNAAFLEALNFAGGSVEVKGLAEETLQGDSVYIKYFDALKRGHAVLDISDCPDLGPVLFAVAAICSGGEFTGTARLRIKESDRALTMKEELEKFGISVEVNEDCVSVKKGTLRKPGTELDGHNDHRIVMSMVVLSLICGGTIGGAEAVKKSYPDFFEVLEALHADIERSEN